MTARADETRLGSLLDRFGSDYAASVVGVVAYRPLGPSPQSLDRYRDSARLVPHRSTLWSTGIVLDDGGLILTCADGAQPGDSLEIRSADGTRRGAVFLAQDPRTGIALVRVDDSQGLTPAASLRCAGSVRELDWVVVAAMSKHGKFDLRVGRLEEIVPAGQRSTTTTLQLDLGRGVGACGGIVLDGDGHFIGMVINEEVLQIDDGRTGHCPKEVATLLDEGEVSAVTRGMLLTLASRLHDAYTRRIGFLGVQVADDPDGLAAADLDRVEVFEAPRPVRVETVLPGSPAEMAGLHAGDEILEIDGRRAYSLEDVGAWIAATPPGDTVEFEILRQGAPMVLSCRIGDRSSLGWMERRHLRDARLRRELHHGVEVLEAHLEYLQQSAAR